MVDASFGFLGWFFLVWFWFLFGERIYFHRGKQVNFCLFSELRLTGNRRVSGFTEGPGQNTGQEHREGPLEDDLAVGDDSVLGRTVTGVDNQIIT